MHSDVDTEHFTGERIIWLGISAAAINQKDVMTFLQGKYPSGSELMFSTLNRKSNVRTLNSKAPPSAVWLCHMSEQARLIPQQNKHLKLITTEGFKNHSKQLFSYSPRMDLHYHQIKRHFTQQDQDGFFSWLGWKRSPQSIVCGLCIICAGFLSEKQSEWKPQKEFLFKTAVCMCWGLTCFYPR